jgi:hypothetical protein
MGMKPDEYYEAFVLGNQEDCIANPGCLRRAFNASVSASHLADHYFSFNTRHNPKLVANHVDNRAFLRYVDAATNGSFRDIRSISNAYKHLYEKERKAGRPPRWSVSSGGSLESVQFEGVGRPLQSVETDYETAPHAIVIFRRRDGTRGEFLPTLAGVVEFWSKLLYGSDA